MWNQKEKPEEQPVSPPVSSSQPKEVPPVSTMPQERKPEAWAEAPRSTVAHIGKSVVIRGELSGSEDLFIDGQVEGTIELREHHLTVGPNGRVQANVNAKEIIIQGTVKGNLRAVDRVEIRKSGSLTGDLVAARVIIEDGAFFKGSIDIQKGGAEMGAKPPEHRKVDGANAVEPARLAGVGAGVEAKKLN